VDPTRLLLTFNVSVNLGDKYHKNTALHWAVLAGNTTVISLLLDANANVDAQNIKVSPPPTREIHPGPLGSAHSPHGPLLVRVLRGKPRWTWQSRGRTCG